MELVSCPACGHAALLALGARLDHPYRWRPWVSVLTYLYLCDWCDALVALGSTRDPLVESLPGSAVLVGVRHRLKREPGYPTDRVTDVEVRERTPDGRDHVGHVPADGELCDVRRRTPPVGRRGDAAGRCRRGPG